MQRLKSTLLALVFLAGAMNAFAQERIEKSFSGVENLRLKTASGNGIIKKGNGNEVKIVLEYTYDEDDYTPTFDQNASTLVIEEEFRRSRWTKGYAEWTLEIPDGMDVNFKTGSGNIEVSGLDIMINAGSGSGNIEMDDMTGEFSASTGSGNLTFNQLEGPLSANTGSGSIRIERLSGNANLNTGSGNIRLRDAQGEFGVNTGSGNLEFQAATIMGKSTFNTGSGNVTVNLAAQLNHDMSLNTGSGNATLDFDGQEIAGRFIMKASDKDDISAPFRFDKESGNGNDDRGWRGRRGSYTKEATIGNKDIVVRISTGSGRAIVRE